MSKWVTGKIGAVKAWLKKEMSGDVIASGDWVDEYTLEYMSGRTERQIKLDEEFEANLRTKNQGRDGLPVDLVPLPDNCKPTNPKDVVGCKKVPGQLVPEQVVMEIGLAMLEGSLKYGGYNYREAGVRASIYIDALKRHIAQWQEGEDIDEASGLSHITKAISTLVVLRDAMLNDMWTDDRPPRTKNRRWMEEYNKKAAEIIDRVPNPVRGFTQKRREEEHGG